MTIKAQALEDQVAAALDHYSSNYDYKDHSVACIIGLHWSAYREKMISSGLLTLSSSHKSDDQTALEIALKMPVACICRSDIADNKNSILTV